MENPRVAQQLYGRRVRELRAARRWSQQRLAREVTCTAAYISLIESGSRVPDETVAQRLDIALEASGGLTDDWRLLDEARHRRSTLDTSTTGGDEEDDVKRRDAIAALAAAGLGSGSLEPLERVWQLVNDHMDPRAEYAVDEWESIPYEYAEAFRYRPLDEVRRDVALDLVELDRLITRPGLAATTVKRLLRSSALLAGILAIASVRVNEIRQARRWWATAATTATQADDVETWTWIRSQEAVMGMYSGWTPRRVIQVADEVIERPRAGWRAIAGAYAARAQASAQLSRKAEAVEALTALEHHTRNIPDSREGSSSLQWAESRTRHTESYVYTFIEETKRAHEAQQRYFSLASNAHPNQIALVKLHQATCISREDLAEGSREMQRLLVDYPDGQVTSLGRQLVGTIPVDLGLPASKELHQSLS